MGEKLEALTISMLLAMPDFHQHLFNEAFVHVYDSLEGLKTPMTCHGIIPDVLINLYSFELLMRACPKACVLAWHAESFSTIKLNMVATSPGFKPTASKQLVKQTLLSKFETRNMANKQAAKLTHVIGIHEPCMVD